MKSRVATIPHPCLKKDWAEMSGDAKLRHCDHCSRSIHNLSEVSPEERKRLLESEGAACIAYYLDRGGSPIYLSDLPWHKRKLIRMRMAFARWLIATLSTLMMFLRRQRGCLRK